MRKLCCVLAVVSFLITFTARSEEKPSVHLALVGLSHDHAFGFLPRFKDRTDVVLVGIVETNSDLIHRYSEHFHLDQALFYATIDALLAKTNVQAVAAFGSVAEHLQVVKACAPHGIDVMMEKPFALNAKQARTMADVAKK